MNIDFINDFNDPYLKTEKGRGVFLAGVLLGYMAWRQARGREKDIGESPLFKQIQFGHLDLKRLKSFLARIPQLTKAYAEDLKYTGYINQLTAKVNELLLKEGPLEMGVDGNFVFTVGFTNANKYFWEIFKQEEKNLEKPEIKEE